MTDDRILWHLENWAYWQRDDGTRSRSQLDDPERGAYPSKASGGMGNSGRSDFDSMCDAVDRRCADAVDTIVSKDLTPAERNVVHHKHVAAVYRFPRLGYTLEQAYDAAKFKVGKGLDRRGIL